MYDVFKIETFIHRNDIQTREKHLYTFIKIYFKALLVKKGVFVRWLGLSKLIPNFLLNSKHFRETINSRCVDSSSYLLTGLDDRTIYFIKRTFHCNILLILIIEMNER